MMKSQNKDWSNSILQYFIYSARSYASPSTWIHSNRTLWCILNGLHVAGYNSAESEPIWMKFGKLSAKCWGLSIADFGRDPHSSHSLRGSLKMFVFCQVNNARFHRFPVGNFHEFYTQQRRSVSWCKLSKQYYKNFIIRGRFPKKHKNVSKMFQFWQLQAARPAQW